MDVLRYGRDRLASDGRADRLEWLVTNGIGGFASGSVSGVLMRRTHGLLVAALDPPLGRTLLVAKLAERIEHDGAWFELDANRWASGAHTPGPPIHLESFALEGGVPLWTWRFGETLLEKRVWMEHGENTTYVQYRLAAGHAPVGLALRALVDHRKLHAITARGEGGAAIEPVASGLSIEARPGAAKLWLFAPGAEVRPLGDWYRGFSLALERERGLADAEDHLCAGEILARLAPGEALTVIASTRHGAGPAGRGPLSLAGALARRRAHEKSLLDAWSRAEPRVARAAPAWVRRLVIAADGFLIERPNAPEPNRRAVIAGYPWLDDLSRDTMIALPGLALATGRPEVARLALAAWARHLDRGMLPSAFPGGEPPLHHTVDAALWMFQAVRAYVERTADLGFLGDLFPLLEDVGAWCERGTRFGVGVDARDGLLDHGEPDVPLTWMDARLDGRAVTPRQGKAVEVNALWFNALTAMAGFARRLDRPAEAYERMAARVERSFERFWNEDGGCLFDAIDTPSGPDASLRPNQILAVSLPDSPLPRARRRAVLEACGRALLTSYGLRSLAPDDGRYAGTGDLHAGEAAVHQGAAWVWLLPHFALAHFAVHRDREAALALLEPLGDLTEAPCAGTLPERVDGGPPHAPRGSIARACSVGETLRAYHAIAGARAAVREPARARARTLQAGA